MRIRDAMFSPYTIVFVVGDLREPVLDALPMALESYVRHPAAAMFRDGLRGPALDDALGSAVVRVDDDLDVRSMILAGERTGVGRLPVRLLIGPRRVAIVVAHRIADGGTALELVTWLATVAAGEPGSIDGRAPQRFPVLRALRAAGPTTPEGYVRAPTGTPLRSTTRSPDRAHAAFVTLTLEPGWHTVTVAARVSQSSVIAATTVRALRRVAADAQDVPVHIPVDLRRYAGAKRVPGNFVGVARFGGLWSGDWTNAGVMQRFRDELGSGAPVRSFVRAMAWWGRHAVAGAAARDASVEIDVSMALLTSRRVVPSQAWRPDGRRDVVAATIGPSPSSTFVGVLMTPAGAQLSVWDESGHFDLDAFPAAFQQELESVTVGEEHGR